MVQNGPSHASGGRVHLASLDWTLAKSMKQTMRLWSSGYDRGFPTTFYYERWEIASNPGSNPGSRTTYIGIWMIFKYYLRKIADIHLIRFNPEDSQLNKKYK